MNSNLNSFWKNPLNYAVRSILAIFALGLRKLGLYWQRKTQFCQRLFVLKCCSCRGSPAGTAGPSSRRSIANHPFNLFALKKRVLPNCRLPNYQFLIVTNCCLKLPFFQISNICSKIIQNNFNNYFVLVCIIFYCLLTFSFLLRILNIKFRMKEFLYVLQILHQIRIPECK